MRRPLLSTITTIVTRTQPYRIRTHTYLSRPHSHRFTCRSSSSKTSSITMGSQFEPSHQEILSAALDSKHTQLFHNIESAIKRTALGPERWYIVALACLVTGPDPEAASQLYAHLCLQPQFSTPEQRQALIRRLREALFKAICIVGVCKPIEAILAIAKLERPEDRDLGFTREGWECDEANKGRALEWYNKIYTRNAKDTIGLFDAHKDFAWTSVNITYGLFLGDRQVLDDLDTELVVFPAIMSQNLKTETWWHIRGTRRIGVSKEDTQVLYDTIKMVAGFYGIKLDRVPTPEEVEHDV